MLFLLPPPDDDAPGGAKAELDQGEASRAAQKVDLDLDDAPFLEDEEEEEAPPAPVAQAVEAAPAKEKKALPAFLKNKLVLIGVPAFLVLAAAAFWWFTRPKAEAPPEPPKAEAPKEAPKPEAKKPEAAKPKAEAPPPPPPTDTLVRMDPFLVEHMTANGTVRFLTARFSLLTKDEKTPVEFQRKIYILRDAVYYYLKNKNLEYLTGRNNTDRLKKDVLGVINQYMGGTQFDNLLIEEYLVK